jgi:3-dehydroquinate synthetase
MTRHLYGRGLLPEVPSWLKAELSGRGGFLLSSSPVLALHGQRVAQHLRAVLRLEVLELPDGEAAKRLSVLEQTAEALILRGAERGSVLFALGGGTVSDLVGFLAAVLFRGISWVALPTTLLAQLDAAVGGKTGVDLGVLKNALGAFHPPIAVLGETEWLTTLPSSELRSGLVEAVKTAAVLDAALFEELKRRWVRLLQRDLEELSWLSAKVAQAKAALVATDFEDRGPRALLNFGHTLGHALEAVTGYSVSHGDAVAHGMRFVASLALPRGADGKFWAELLGLLERLGVPKLPPVSEQKLLAAIGRDKKTQKAKTGWVIPFRPGEAQWGVEVPDSELRESLRRFLSDGTGS